MNRVVLVGRITKDPELKKTNNNNSVVNFTIAVNRTFANASGEREADFINCVAWNKTAENMATYLGKGSLIGVDGKIQTRTYEDRNLTKHYVTEVFVDNLQFLEQRQGNNQLNGNEQANTSQNGFVAQNGSNDVLSDFGINDDDFRIDDEELPF